MEKSSTKKDPAAESLLSVQCLQQILPVWRKNVLKLSSYMLETEAALVTSAQMAKAFGESKELPEEVKDILSPLITDLSSRTVAISFEEAKKTSGALSFEQILDRVEKEILENEIRPKTRSSCSFHRRLGACLSL